MGNGEVGLVISGIKEENMFYVWVWIVVKIIYVKLKFYDSCCKDLIS